MNRDALMPWIVEALVQLNGRGNVVAVCKRIWENHEKDLRTSGDMFYKWQYEVRHAATMLVDDGRLRKDAHAWVLLPE